jgi:AcrR family transcriptional regulator
MTSERRKAVNVKSQNLEAAEVDPRQRILEAATRIFAEKGREGARTREIAQAANVNLAMLHYYFSSKEELYVRVLTPIFEELFSRLKLAAGSSAIPTRRLEAVVGVYFDFLKGKPDLPRLIMWDLVTGAHAMRQTFQRVFSSDKEGLMQLIHGIFKEGQKGKLPPEDADQSVISMVALCVFPFIARPMLEIINPGVIQWLNFLARRQDHVLDLLLNTFADESKP